MDVAEMHRLSVAFQERHAVLRRLAEWYATNPVGQGWTDLAAENAIRLEELDRIVAKVPSGCQSDYLGGPGCICMAVAR